MPIRGSPTPPRGSCASSTRTRGSTTAVVEFSERLAATLPEPLDTVFLVNSGSEASDLAIRLATAATGRRDVLAVREAYHGWTYATDAVSTSTADNPNALATRPDWVHTVESPNSFRGKYRGRGRGALRRRGGGSRSTRLTAEGRPLRGSSARACTAMPAAWRCRTATCSRCMPRCAPRAGWRSPTRSRSAMAVSANGSGAFTSRGGAGHRVDRQVHGQRLSAGRGDHQPGDRRSASRPRATSSPPPVAARCRARSA